MLADWAAVKSVLQNRNLSAQYTIIGANYWIKAIDGVFEIECILPTDTSNSDSMDFVTNFIPNGNNKNISAIQNIVTTQYELNDKDLKLAKIKASVVSGTPNQAQVRLKVPGTFGDNNAGRWVAGGDGWVDSYDPDDYLIVDCYDDDRLIAAAYGGLTDEQMQGQGDFPNYPLIKTYTDDELTDDNRGWYFWPIALGNNLAPQGEVEFEPIAGYGHIPGGLYLVITLIRPNQTTGTLRGNLFWGKKE